MAPAVGQIALVDTFSTATSPALNRYDMRIDVSEAISITGAEISASIVVPANFADKAILAVGFPGGGYAKGYWDIRWPGNYSQAEFHAHRGWAFAAVDHLGVGESSLLDPSLLTFETMAAANAAATQYIVSTLRSGALPNPIDPQNDLLVIGMGQSMGGCLSIVAQAAHHSFDALAVLGFSASHTVLPSPEGGIVVTPISRGRTDVEGLTNEAAEIGEVHVFAWSFHYDDVDPGIYHEDLRGGYPFRTDSIAQWGSATLPPAAASMLSPGAVGEEAAAVNVPVFIGVGERDVCPDPWSEPACYRSSQQVSLCVVDRMAHMHNFASTREILWDRLHRWGGSLI